MAAETQKQAGWKQRLAHEVTEYLINFVYLAVVFGAFTSYRRLILAAYQVSYMDYGIAVIEAAILAKIIMMGDVARLGRRYEDRPLIIPTLHKTLVFAIWVFGVKVVEHVIGALLRGKSITTEFHDLFGRDGYELFANALVVFAALIPFFAIRELGRVLGRDKLSALFFWRGTVTDSGSS